MAVVQESTTVAIVGGGVSGLTTALLLRSAGIDSVILERRDRAYVEERQRAGLVEHRAVAMFEQWGLGHVLHGFPGNDFLEVRVDGVSHLLPEALPGMEGANKAVPQQLLVKGLMAELLDGRKGNPDAVRFEVSDVVLHGLDGLRPLVTYTDADGLLREIECDFVAGCDGDRGVSAAYVPNGVTHSYDYGITWLTVLADAPAPKYALQATGSRGWAAQFARGRAASRFYLHIPAGDTAGHWPHDRIWTEIKHRMHDPELPDGPVTMTEVFPLRSSIREPMSYGRLFLQGDAAHIIPPMGAKGMNLALFDAETFAAAVRDFTRTGDDAGLRAYSGTCLDRTWRYQEYSNWLADMMHGAAGAPVGGGGSFRERIMRARLDRLLSSDIAARYYQEMFTGLG